jgi:hypothetical protein
MTKRSLLLGVCLAATVETGAAAAAPPPANDCGVARPAAPSTPTSASGAAGAPGEPAPPVFTRSAVIIPPLLYVNAEQTFWEVALLYWKKTDPERGERLRLVVPFLVDDCAPDRRTVVTPLGGWRTDAAGTAGFVLDYFFRRDADHRTDAVFPFYWNIRSRRADGEWRTDSFGLPPFVVRFDNQGMTNWFVLNGYYRYATDGSDRWDAGVTPFYFGGHSPERDYTVIPPALYVHYRSAESETTVLGPAFRYRAPGKRASGVLPLYAHVKEPDEEVWVVPPALTLRWRGPDAALTLVGPFYDWSTPTSRASGLAPLVMRGRSADEHYLFVPPLLFFHWGDKNGEGTLAGPIYAGTRPDGYDVAIAPFLFTSRTGEQHFTLALPGILHFGDGIDETTVVGPIYHRETAEGRATGVAPFFFSSRDADGSHYVVVPPALFLHAGDSTYDATVAGPIYAYRGLTSGHHGFAPLYMAGDFADGDRYTVLPPLAFVHASGDESETTVVGPAYYHAHKKDRGWSAGLLPVAFAGRTEEDTSYTIVPPLLFGRVARADGSSTTLAGPVYVSATKDTTTAAVLPVAYYKRTPDTTRLTVFPLLHYSETPESTTVIGPLFYHDRDATSEHTVAPLYYSSRHADDATRVLFPFYWDFENTRDDSRLQLALPLYAHYRKGASETTLAGNMLWTSGRTAKGPSWSFHFFPLFDVESAYPEHLKWRVLYGLAGRERSGAWHRWQAFYVWTDPTT